MVKVEIPKYRDRYGKCWYKKQYWREFALQEAAKDLEEFDLPLASIDLTYIPWEFDNFRDVIYHFNQVNNVNLKHPIILNDVGCIIDGFHRIVKAIIEGKETIKAVRFNEMPQPDGKEE